MLRWRIRSVSLTLVAAVVAGGCAPPLANPHDHGGGMVDEYRPAVTKPVERRVADSGEYVLWRWQPLPPATGPAVELLHPTTVPAPEAAESATRWTPAVQVEHVYVHHGQPVGFRRRPNGQLVAVAGAHVRLLEPGRYCWHRLPGEPRESHVDLGPWVPVAIVVTAVTVVVVGLFAIDHNDHHAHLGRTINHWLNGDDCDD